MKTIAGTLFLFCLAFAAIVLIPAAHAAGPQVILSWTADSAVPAAYPGKALPSPGSQMTASVEVFSGGSFANLQSKTVYWYLDGSYIGGGVGKQTVSFMAPGHLEIMSLRAQITNFAGSGIMDTEHIQMADPSVVIVAPYPGRSFSGSTVQVQAAPYYWKASKLNNLTFAWTVNGQTVTAQENPQDLTINLDPSTAPGYQLSTNVLIKETDDPLLSGQDTIMLTKAQ